MPPKTFAENLRLVLQAREFEERTKDRTPQPAAASACRDCPYLRANYKQDHPDGWFTEEQSVQNWSGVRVGDVFACHKTHFGDHQISDEARAAGYRPSPKDVDPRECAGALTLSLRELALARQLGSYERYLALRGEFGLEPEAFARLARRLRGSEAPAIRQPLVDDPAVGVEWIPWPLTADPNPLARMIVPPCQCPVCTRHAEAHPQQEMHPPQGGEPIAVDAALAPLLAALWRVGGETLASCQDFAGALEQLDPGETRMHDVDEYGTILARRLAYVRALTGPAVDRLAAAVEATPAGEVIWSEPLVRIGFSLADVERLVEAL